MGGAKRKFAIVEILGKSYSEVHASHVANDAEEITELALEGGEEDATAFGVESAHAADVAREVTFAEKIREHGLVEMGRTDVHGVAHGEEWIDEIGRNDEVADAKRGEEHFAEGANVDNAGSVVETLEGGNGLALVAKLAVVVIFDDPRAGLAGPMQELKTTRGGHGDAEGILVRRSDKGSAGGATKLDAGGNVEAFGVDGNGNDAATGSHEDVAGEPVAGFFKPDGVAGIEEDASGKIEGLLRAADDRDLLRIAVDAARGAEINGDNFTQMLQAGGIAVFETAREGIATMASDEVGPDFERKGVESGLTDAEGAITTSPRIAFVGRKLKGSAGEVARTRGGVRRSARRGGRGLVRERTGDERSSADAGPEIAFGEELSIGRKDGNARDAEFGSESAGGGNLLAGGEVAADDGGAEAVVDLPVEGTGGFAIDEDERGKRGRGFAHGE